MPTRAFLGKRQSAEAGRTQGYGSWAGNLGGTTPWRSVPLLRGIEGCGMFCRFPDNAIIADESLGQGKLWEGLAACMDVPALSGKGCATPRSASLKRSPKTK